MGACVTINIYFPAEKVESVAGEIVQEIRGKETDTEKAPEIKKNSALPNQFILALVASVAYAQDVTEVSNPTIRGLKDKMKARFDQMKPFYQKGAIGEGDNGYVSIKSTDGLGLKEKRDIKALVDAENNDRRQLYQEVAKALNIDPGQLNRVAEIFAKEWKKSVQ
jgi:uncharacterized protein YdbL (DUF1318 family)